MTEEQRDVYLYRRPITSLAKVPVLNKWAYASINHWAVCVGETCYEVARIHDHHPTGKSHDIRVLTKAEWIQYAQQQKLAYQYANYGKCNAKWKDDDIKECGKYRSTYLPIAFCHDLCMLRLLTNFPHLHSGRHMGTNLRRNL